MKPTWESGGVQLFCADALDVLSSLVPGSVQCAVVDPPYGINCTKTGCGEVGRKGFLYGGDFTQLGGATIGGDKAVDGRWLSLLFPLMADDSTLYSFSRWDVDHKWQSEIAGAGFTPKNRIIWVKANHGSGDLEGAFGFAHETIWRAGKGRPLLRCKRGGDVWRDSWTECVRHGKEHPFEKPVDLLERCIVADSDQGDMVLDCYMGSGSTACAAIRTGRKFVGSEIDPAHFETTVRRVEAELSREPLFNPAPKFTQRELIGA